MDHGYAYFCKNFLGYWIILSKLGCAVDVVSEIVGGCIAVSQVKYIFVWWVDIMFWGSLGVGCREEGKGIY